MEEQYIPYGQDQVDVQEMNKLLADNVEPYLSSKRWSPEQKNKWRQAYGDLMNRGILGISTDGGRYSIEHNGVPFVDTEGYYGDVANFITTNLSSIAKKKEEEKKVELPKYNLDQDFTSYFMNQYYGGTGESNFENFQNTWSNLDKADKYGIRRTDVRRGRLKEALKNYVTYLDENKDKYNYDNGVFKNLDDLKGRLNAAIQAMDTPDQQDDIDTLNALGIRPDFLDTGANRIVTLTDGTQMTASQYRDNDLKQQEQAKLASNKQAQANQFKKVRFISAKNFNGTPPTGQNVLEKLNGYYSLGNLNGQQQSELIGAFKFAERNNALKPLSKEELTAFGSLRGANRLRKIDGLNGFYWDSAGQRIVQPFMNSGDGTQSFQDLVNQNSPEYKQAQIKSQLVKQMNQPIQGSLNLSDLSNFGFDEATGNELWAVINDIGAFADPEAISGTALALNAARLRDKNREGWSWERVLDWGTSALGGLPIIGDAASIVKAGSNLVKLANRSARVGSFIGMAFSAVNMPEAWDSIKKIYDKGITSMTPQDIQNITYGLMGLFAGIKTINAVNARQKPQTATEHSIEIDGKKVKLPDQVTADKVSAEYKAAKNNTEASQKVVKMQEVREAAKKAGIEVTDASKVTSGSGFLRGNQVSRKLGIGKSPVKSEQVNTGEMTGGSSSRYYMPSWRRSFLNQEQKEIKNPLRKTFDWFLGKAPEVKSTETPKPIQSGTSKGQQQNNQQSSNQKTWSEIEKEPGKWEYTKEMKDYKNALTNLSNKDVVSGEFKGIKGENIKVVEQTDGSFNLMRNGNIIGNYTSKMLLKKEIAKLLQDVRKSVKQNKSPITSKEIGKVLQDLKARGWLKQGGKIDNPSVDDIINNYFKNKQI